MRIPYDSLTLAAVVAELQPYVGGKLQRVVQPDNLTLGLGLYANGREAFLLISCDPVFFRAHFVTARPASPQTQFGLCSALRSKVDGARLTKVEQVGFDRILKIEFQRAEAEFTLIAELMGKHSNIILTEEGGRIAAASKWIGRAKSSRIIQAGAKYVKPPFPPRPSLLDAKSGDDLKATDGASPFLLNLIAKGGTTPEALRALTDTGFAGAQPILSAGNGAYPISVAALGLDEIPRPSVSVALEQHYQRLIPAHEAESLRAALVGQLERVILAREVAIAELDQTVTTAKRAGELQLKGELLLAYAGTVPVGASIFESQDYEGNPITIKLDAEKSALENANAFFDKAKKAKSRLGMVQDQIVRLSSDLAQVRGLVERIKDETSLDRMRELKEVADGKRWLMKASPEAKAKEDRPYEGHRIREMLGPGGVMILFGENSESNDYLTLRVARPNDWWLHVRGGVSCHVVIQTGNKPEKIGPEALNFAAKVAVAHSPSKHSGYVAVDYTLKKYVRRPKGAPKGTVLYTHEKTLHVDQDR